MIRWEKGANWKLFLLVQAMCPESARIMRLSPMPSSALARERMRNTKRRDTEAELRIRSELFARGLRYRVDYPLPGTRSRADIAFVRARLAVFIDGCFWHGCPKHGTWPTANHAWWRDKIQANQRRDKRVCRQGSAAGWRVVRFWEHEDAGKVAVKIASILET